MLFPYEELIKFFQYEVRGVAPRGLVNCGNRYLQISTLKRAKISELCSYAARQFQKSWQPLHSVKYISHAALIMKIIYTLHVSFLQTKIP